MDWLQGIFQYIGKVWNWLYCFFPNFFGWLSDWLMDMLFEIMSVAISALGVIPLPDVLTSFQWPDAGPFGYALIDLGVPQGLAILSAAFMVRFLKGLIPLIRS
ncbi:hypothetical protein A45J_2427 [hot springs metagenome]|uniref:DUF2523 domain-containing protein n=1 Tax=hot springs metagenome TaxID=433727 RepID=A0A5J4L4N7_9ZZZZ